MGGCVTFGEGVGLKGQGDGNGWDARANAVMNIKYLFDSVH